MTPGGHRAKLMQQKQGTGCDPDRVLHTPRQPRSSALVSDMPLSALTFARLNISTIHSYSFMARLGCTKTEVKNRIQRTRLLQDKGYKHMRLEKTLDNCCKTALIRYYFKWWILAHSHVNSWQIYSYNQHGFGGLGGVGFFKSRYLVIIKVY